MLYEKKQEKHHNNTWNDLRNWCLVHVPFGDTMLCDSEPYVYKYAHNHLGKQNPALMSSRWRRNVNKIRI